MKPEDFRRGPCACPECRQAGVDEKPQLRDPQSGRWLHGYDLRRNYDAADRFRAQLKALSRNQKHAMPAAGIYLQARPGEDEP
jgi:hypothetical protein